MAELTSQQTEWLTGLREMADFMEANPDLIPSWSTFMVNLFQEDDETSAQFLARMARRLGTASKEATEPYFYLVRRFGPHDIRATAARDKVCERVQVGIRTVTEEVPDPAHVIDVPTITVTREEPVYDWICPDSILRPISQKTEVEA